MESPEAGPKLDVRPPGPDIPPLSISVPSEIPLHLVPDGTLDLLADARREHFMEAMWDFAGGAIGSFVPFATAIYNSYFASPHEEMTVVDLLQVVTFVVCVGIAGALKVVNSTKSKSATDIVAEIRKQTKWRQSGSAS